MPRPAYSGPWANVRAYVLKRDGYRCKVQLPGVCTVIGTCVDHIDPVALAGPTFDPAELRAACQPCNSVLGGQVARMRQRAAELVVGPSRAW